MKPREQKLAGLLLAVGLVAIMWFAYSADSSQEGGQFRQLGQQLGERRGGVNQSQYKYVANFRTKQYWPNQATYVSRIPAAERVFILDSAALADFRGYRPGPR